MTDLVRWEPFREMRRVRDEMSQLLTDSFLSLPGRLMSWQPATDLYETADSFVVKADLPGYSPEDVDITFTSGLLTISGERKVESEEKAECYYCKERSFGRFSRSFQLSPDIDTAKIQATFRNGTLEVTLPKPEEARPKTIKIEQAK